MAKRVRWTGNAADLPKDTSERHVRYVGMGTGGNTYQPYAKTENNAARTVTVEDTLPDSDRRDRREKFDAGQYAGDAGKLFLNGVAEGLAATGASVENLIGKGLDKLFPGAGFEGSGLFNVLYNGRPDWKWAGENGLVGIKQDREYNQESLQQNADKVNNKVLKKAAEFGGDIAYGLGNAAPMAAEAMATGGASVAANLTKEGLLKTGAEVVEKTGVLNTLSKATRDMLTSKDYWTSFASEVGMDYYDAKDNGATEDEALRYALYSAGLNSVIEIGGGIQKIPERPTFKTWLKSAHEEGMEEVQQGIVSRLLENAVYNKGNPIVSVKDDSAVINPVTAVGEYAGGAVVGGILSGGEHLTQRAINRAARAERNKQAKKVYGDTAQDLVEESLELNPNNELATRLQNKLDNGEELTGNELRQLVEQNEDNMVTSDKASIQSAVEGRLSELGATKNVSKMAEIITQQISGENVADSDRQLVENSKVGRQVSQELNPENIRVGAANEAWTGKIGTARINTTAYNRDMQKTGVTGAKYNAETGRLDAIVTNEAGEVKTVPAAEAEMTPMQEELFDWADELKLEAAGPLMVRAYQPEQNMELYTRSFKLAYEYGKAGMPMDYVEKSEGVNYLHPTQIKLAYEEGQAATQRKVQAREERIRSGGTTDSTTKKKGSVSLRGATVGGKTYAPVNRKTVDSRQWASVKAMRAFSRAVGVDVVFYQSQANERGVYEGANGFYKDGKLYLDINAGRDTVDMTETAILKTAAHELTHFIQANSAQYEALKSFVVNKLTHEEGVSFEDLVADKQRREPGLEYDEAVDEVVADACEMMLGNSTAVEQLAKENRSLAEKIRDWLREWVENLKIALEGLQADRTESRAMMQYARELQEIWDNALMDAARNNRGTVEKAAPAESRRQVRENFSNEIDSWAKDGMPEGVRFTLGSTGPVLQGLGAIESDIYMEGDKIQKILQDHPEMTLAEIKKVPQILEDPALILKSEGRGKSGANSRLVCFGLTKAQNGQPVMTVMDLRPRENGFVVDDMQKVNSAYTKKNPMAFIQKSDVVYADKKRAIPLLRTTGLTISSQQLLRNGYVGSISYKGGSVNIEGVPFSSVVKMEANDKVQNSMRDSAGRELTEAQQAYFKDSKVRDADGKLKLVYHGSAAIFTKFSADFMSQNGSSEGQGFYFTDYKPMAQGYEKNGGQLLEGYLDIKKPLSDSEVTLTAAEVKRLIRAVDPTGDDLVLNYDSRGGMGYPSRAWYNRSVEDTLRATMSTSDSDSEILAELANGMGDPGKVLKTVRELLGYDGYIVEGKYDNATVYVAFDSSQFKNADNKTPTADPDIRYQQRDNLKEEYHLTDDEKSAIRGAAREATPAELKRQAQAESGESIEPGEKPLKGKRDDGKMGTAKASLKEDFEDGKARKENRGDFLRRTVEEGYQVFEGKSAAYGYRPVRRESAGENAQQIQKELTELGIDAEIIDGDILWNLDGISSARRVPQATTVEKNKVMVSTDASLAPRNTAGHEAFHLWYGLSARRAFEDVVTDNLNFSSKEFIGYQSAISEAYLGDEADLSDETQYTKLMEEIIAYISGDIHEGVNDDLLRPMFRDYDAVKAAWVKLCKDRTGGEVRFSVRESFSKEIDSWAKDGMPEGVRFTLGSTGPVLQGLGAIESDIYMDGDKIQKILQDHPEMTLAEIKKVPQILEDPAMVLKSKTRTNSLVVLGTYRAQNGRPILAAMDLLPMENGVFVHGMQKLSSAYTKTGEVKSTGADKGAAFLRNSDVLFLDKKRATLILRPMGIQTPTSFLQSGYIGSISYKGSSVNIQGRPFSSVVKIEADNRDQNQQRDPRLSDRDVLRMAADMAQRDRSQRWSVEDLNRFDVLRRKLVQLDEANAELEALQEERETLLTGRKAKELTKDERFELAQNRNRTETQKGRIQRLEAEAYKLESVPQVKALLKKSRSIVEREADSRARAEFREAREKQEMLDVTRRKVERNAKRLLEYMNTNTDKKHIPEALKKPIGELLESLNFYSNSARKGGRKTRADQRYCEAMQGLQNALAAQKLFDDTGEGTDLFQGYLDLPAGFESMLGVHVDRVKLAMEKHPLKTDIVREMDLNDLKELDVILSVMSRSVTKMNEMFVNRRFAYVADAAEDSIEAMDRLGQHQDKAKGVEQFALWDNTLPWYAFQRFGEGGKAVFEGLQDGWDKLAFNMKIILDFRRNLIKDVVARKWDTETHKVELTDPDGATVTATLTTAQLMSLYCLSKRKQALGHLLGGGIRPAAIELTDTLGDRVRKRSLTQDKQYKLTEESLGQLLKLLTPEQKKIADAMQKFMTEQGSAWGNAVTMARFGYRGFTEQNYFPIETDAQDRQAKTGDTKEGSLYRLQNISAVKPLVKNANNALILRGIFDVFANHTADMAKYNAMVLPIIDAQKWYNYKYASKNEAGQVSTRTVQRAMTRAYGGAANSFVIKYLQDLNGVKETGDRGTDWQKKMISNYKRAMVAANMRVALLQPTAYVRASAVLDYKYLVKAFADKTGTKQATKEMLENSGIALWKSLGFFDTDVGRSVRDQIKGKSGKLENLVDKTMIPAEKGDEITWARLWRACKLEVQDKQSLTGDELLKATAERFREVVYRTQVVDSTMTRSHMMRGNGTLSKMTTSFMSEPTVSYNMVMESTRQIAEDAKRLGMRVALRRNWKAAGRAYQAYIVSAVVTAIVESLYDALRDSDDDDYLDKVWKAFGGEKPETVKDGVLNVIFGLNGNLAGDINPIGKVPYLRDVVSILGGYSNGRMDTEAAANLKKAVDIWDEVIRLQTGDLDKATKTTYYGNMTTYGMIYPTAKALSQLTGLPGSAAMREIVTAWNSTVGAVWPNLKQRTYENKKLREAWENYGKDSGISYATMYQAVEAVKEIEGDKDADGNTISGSQKAKYVEYIRSLGLPRAQEKAVWEAAKVSSWSDKGTPWG